MAPSKKRPAPADLPALAEQLVAEPKQKANNLPVLLAALKPGCSEATSVLHNLRIFFIDSFDRGDLSVKPPAEDDKSPEAVYAAWLHRQYAAYQSALLALLGNAAVDARIQVASLMALLECVRGERPGVFNNRLFHRVLVALLTRQGTAPEVLGLLIGKLLELADVRYFTLASIIRIAGQHRKPVAASAQLAAAVAAASRAGGRKRVAGATAVDLSAEGRGQEAEEGQEQEEEEEEEEQQQEGAAAAAGEGDTGDSDGEQLGPHDLARNLHDILAEMPAGLPEGELRSWCGAAEVGIVTPANVGQGARQRKRQRLAAEAAAAEGAAAGERQRAKWANAKAHQRMYSDAWLAVLRMDFPEDIYKKVLARMADKIIPSLINPLLLADFLTETLDRGGLTGMLALHGIFLLVTKHGLEYPKFYARLYQLLTPEAFHAKHRARFFSLADVFLASGMVPAYTAGAFAKKLARLALSAPPAGALLALAFVHNIIRRHPATMQLLHRPPRGGLAAVAAGRDGGQQQQQQQQAAQAAAAQAAPQPLLPLPPEVAGPQAGAAQQQQEAANGSAQAAAGSESEDSSEVEEQQEQAQAQQQQAQQQQAQGPVWQGQDVFDFDQPDPAKSRALESSLWELEALRQHHSPQVAAYCTMLDKDLRDRKTSEADISELLTASYASMFASEVSRRLKAVPTAFYRTTPESLFGAAAAADFPGWRV